MSRYALDGARSDLSDAAEIIALLAQDMNDLRREHHGATHEDLLALGWTKAQVRGHFLSAIKVAFASYCETREPDFQAQAADALQFDAAMRRQLAQREAFGEGAPPALARIFVTDDANEVA